MKRPRLQTILFAVNLVILLLPLGGIAVLRIYESALLRQTESELIGQGALLAAAFRDARARSLGRVPSAGVPGSWQHRGAVLDLANDFVHPPAPAALEPAAPPEPAAAEAGAEIAGTMRAAQLVTLAAMRVVDGAGVVVASTGEDLGRSIAHFDELGRALRGETVSLLRERISDEPEPPLSSLSRGTGIRVFVAMPVVDEGRVVGAVLLSRTPRSLAQTLAGKRSEIVAGVAGLLTVVVALTVFTALTIDRPLARLLAQARRATSGERGAVVPLAHPVTADVAELSEGFVAMARALEEREDYLRGFASQASHELKTPLASIRGSVELLQDHAESMSADERARFLANLGSDVERLERLVRRLLELARADVLRPAGASSDAVAVVERAATRHRRSGLEIEVAAERSRLPVAIADDLLDGVVGNLLENARQHGGERPKATIEIRETAGEAEIVIADEGPGIPAADRARIFDPFFTTARASGGTGLGLSIARAIVKAHGGTLELVPSDHGARFRVTLPAPVSSA